MRQIEKDKKKIEQVIANLEKKKEEVINLAFNQVTKDFGSIFGTLLPGASAKLQPPLGKKVLEGLEVSSLKCSFFQMIFILFKTVSTKIIYMYRVVIIICLLFFIYI